ncbi:MAG: TonB-dependent receptor [Xanthomonadales bacterium]|nr:TonB-dependent receptor [Xanthomonadales bacterium]
MPQRKRRHKNVRRKSRRHMKASVSLIAIPVGLGCFTPAYTQVLEEVLVTATRRAESVQDIPVNIAAVGGAQLEQQGFGDLSEMVAFVPGMNVVDQGGRDGNRIVVRGLNADPVSNSFGQENGGGTVATYVGEIPLFVDLRLNDLERVEVLLGPQGTLYGAGTMGGAIRYIPKKPDFSGQFFDVRSDIYSYDEGSGLSTDVGLTFNYPISDTFAIRASIDRLDDQGFIDYPFVVQQPGVSNPDPDFSDPADRAANFNPLSDVNTEEVLSGRIAARWQPTDTVDATLTYYFQQTEHGGRSVSGQRGTVPAGEYDSPFRVPEPNDRDTELLALEITADLGFAELTSATGLANYEEAGQRDQTDLLITLEYSYETFPTFTAFTFEDEEAEIFNQELRLVSSSDGPLNWIVGAFYNVNEYDALSSEFTPGYGAFVGPDFRQDLNDLEYFEVDRTELKEFAVFGEVSYDLTEHWTITLGARYYDYTYDTYNATEFPYFTTPETFQPFPLSEIGQFPLSRNQEFDGDLYKLNAAYAFDNGNTAYFTFSQGYRVGASNGGEPCPDVFVPGNQSLCLLAPGQQFGPNPGDIAQINEREYFPDTVDNWEIGLKTTWLDGALTVNGSVFFIDWENPQVASASVNAGTNITVNAGAAETKGFDVAVNWLASENLSIRGSFSYTNAELTEGVPSLIRTISPPGFGTAFEDGQAGDQLPGSPETQFSFFASYRYPLSSGNTLVFDGGYAWQDEVLSLTGARGNSLTLPDYGRANVAVAYEATNWTVTGYVDNLFDEYTESSVFNTPLYNQTVSGANVRYYRTNVLAPRSYGLRFRYSFE